LEGEVMGNKYLSMIAAAELEPAPSMPITSSPQNSLSRPNPNDYRETVAETHLRLDRLAAPQSASQLKAKELMRTCREHAVALRLDPDGALVIVSNGNAWRALVNEIELHIDDIAELLMSGWEPMDA
jgi:hypothetical protein